MERKGGCCLAPRYGAAAAAQQAGAAWQQMGRIMLKFRPIAPKPAAMAPTPAPTPVTGPAVGAGRGKRKAVCGGGGRRGRKPKKAATFAVVTAAPAPAAAAAKDVGDCKKKSSSSRSSSSSGMTSVDSSPPPRPQQHQLATLPLMPVTAVEDKAAAGAATEEPAPLPSQVTAAATGAVARPFAPRAMHRAAAASLVKVEEVTVTWRTAPSSAACVVRFVNRRLFSHIQGFAAENGALSTEVIQKAFGATEEEFIGLVQKSWPSQPRIVFVGSCCLVGAIENGTLYVANLGDSRAVLGRRG